MRKIYSNIMFDLDGTVTDSERAIVSAVKYALGRQGITEQPPDKLRRFIGPALFDSFTREFGMDPDSADTAVADYRAVYEAGLMYDVDVYPGIPRLLERLAADGRRIILVTAKPEVFSSRILEHVGLRKYFSYIAAPLPAIKDSDKSKLIERAVRELGLNKDDCVMIGDTLYDIEGAKSAGVDCIGVGFGFGRREDLAAAGADYIAECAQDIEDLLL